jgi:protein-S-isoprenylcysteine O-methyltransferase Ste14
MKVDRSAPKIMMVPPPLLFVLTFLAGAGIQALLPIPVLAESMQPTFALLGGFLLALGVAFALPSALLFLAARTSIVPQGYSSTLITWGTYRFTRNPMYLGLVLVFVGVAFLKGLGWPLALLPIPVLVMDRVVIPFEENQLVRAFGDTYEAYRARVRRWI